MLNGRGGGLELSAKYLSQLNFPQENVLSVNGARGLYVLLHVEKAFVCVLGN